MSRRGGEYNIEVSAEDLGITDGKHSQMDTDAAFAQALAAEEVNSDTKTKNVAQNLDMHPRYDKDIYAQQEANQMHRIRTEDAKKAAARAAFSTTENTVSKSNFSDLQKKYKSLASDIQGLKSKPAAGNKYYLWDPLPVSRRSSYYFPYSDVMSYAVKLLPPKYAKDIKEYITHMELLLDKYKNDSEFTVKIRVRNALAEFIMLKAAKPKAAKPKAAKATKAAKAKATKAAKAKATKAAKAKAKVKDQLAKAKIRAKKQMAKIKDQLAKAKANAAAADKSQKKKIRDLKLKLKKSIAK
jgi:hypothetical protein